MGRSKRTLAFVLTAGVTIALALAIALAFALMINYDLRHAGEFECAPGEVGGQTYYPCGRDEPYYVHPSGLELLRAFLTWQPEPTPVLVMPPP